METAKVEEAQQVSGAELLDELQAWFARFIAVTFDADLALLALWTVHTHLAEELYSTPRLRLDSTMEGAGKTTVLEHLSRLCHAPILVASLSSPALLPRMLHTKLRTVLLDEVHRTLAPDSPGVGELLSILNSGYRVGATRPVLVRKGDDWVERELSTFAPLAMAGNAPNLPADTRSREIRVLLVPDLGGSLDDSDWESVEDDAHALRDRVAVFAESVRDQVKGMRVELPEGCVGRTREKWRPLKRVAIAAGGRWPAAVDALIATALQEEADEREAGLRTLPPGVVLLNDLHAVWPAGDDELTATKTLVARLIDHHPDYWGEQSAYGRALTEQRFGKLSSQAAKATSQRPRVHGPRGFFRSQFLPVWRQMRLEGHTVQPDHIGDIGDIGSDGAETIRCNRFDRSDPVTPHVRPDTGSDGDSMTVCARCDKELTDPEAMRRGICVACFLRSKHGSTPTDEGEK